MKWNHKYYKKLQIGIDSVSLLLSLLLAVFIKKGGFVFPKTFYDFSFIFLLLVIWFLAANECRLYRNRINKKFPEEILYNAYTNILFLILVSSFLFLSKSCQVSLFSLMKVGIALKYSVLGPEMVGLRPTKPMKSKAALGGAMIKMPPWSSISISSHYNQRLKMTHHQLCLIRLVTMTRDPCPMRLCR